MKNNDVTNSTSPSLTFVVADDLAHYQGERLDKAVVEQSEQTRSQVQKLIKEGCVTINDKVVTTVHKFLQPNDRIAIMPRAIADPALTPPPVIPVIAETDDYVVINKPSGVLTHATPKHERGTVADWAVEHFPAIRTIGDDPWRPGIVHRLDRDVSGLMVIAKTWTMFEHLKEQFQQRTVVKKYTVLVHGNVDPEHPHSTIDLPIGRAGGKTGIMAAHPRRGLELQREQDKPALTEYWITTSYKRTTLLEVWPHTGRMHQIRVHCKAIGHPIVGDPLYKSSNWPNPKTLPRLFLHATNLTFTDLQGQPQTFNAPLPNVLADYLKSIS